MKKVLLGTTALVAAGAFAGIGAAQAQDMMVGMQPLELGGYYTIAMVSLDTDGAKNDRGHGFQQNIELEGRGSVELDNGITAGVRIRINANNGGGMHDHGASLVATRRNADDSADELDVPEGTAANAVGGLNDHTHGAGKKAGGDLDNISEAEVFFTGSFGGLHIGMIEAASQQMTIWAPGGNVPIGGVKSAWFGNSLAGWTTGAFMDEDSTKIVYFTPSFNGISIGVSYAPEDTNHSYAGSSTDDGGQSEQITAAIGYSTAVMGGSVSGMVGYETYSTESSGGVACDAATMSCDPTAMRYGLSVSVDNISIGGAINDQDGTGNKRMGMPNEDRTMTDVGVSWSEGPLGLGLQHATDDKNDYDETAFMVNYNLGGGVDIGLKLGSGSSDDKKGMSQDFTQILLGTMFNF